MPGTVGTEGVAAPDAPDHDAAAAGFGPIVVGYSAFLALLIPVFLYVGRDSWFAFDDWDYLVNRKAGSLQDLLRPHNGHWEAIPVLVYRSLFSVFGLRYLPFEFVSIAGSFAGAALLLLVMLRARTRPWIAVLVASLLVFFGDGQFNVAMRVTSITFVGFAVPLGLVQMILADHDGPRSRRDWVGLGVAMVALLCSNVATVMIFAVGLAMLLKRGWRVALFHVGPPFVVFVTWFVTKGRHDTGAGNPAKLQPISQALHFASVLVTGAFESLTRTHSVGGPLAVLFLVALAIALWKASPERRREAIVPGALLAGAAFFAFETGLGRANILDQGAHVVRQGHYLYGVVVLMLPALAFLAEETVRHWRRVAPVLFVVTLVGVVANANALQSHEDAARKGTLAFRNSVLLIPRLPVAQEVPPKSLPFLGSASPITIGWLLQSLHQGRLPRPTDVTPRINALATLRLSLVTTLTPPTTCRPFTAPVGITLTGGAAFKFRGSGVIVSLVDGNKSVASSSFNVPTSKPLEWKIVNRARTLDLSIRPAQGNVAPQRCD